MVACRWCKEQIRADAINCPKCGGVQIVSRSGLSHKQALLFAVLVVLALLFVMGAFN